MVRPERLELPAYWFEASRSIQLSYGRTPRSRDPVRILSFRAALRPGAGAMFVSRWGSSFAVKYLRKVGNLCYLQRILGHSSTNDGWAVFASLGVGDVQKVHDGLSLLSHG